MNSDRPQQLESLVGSNVSRETIAALDSFAAQFLRWSKRINLAAPSTLPDFWHRHVLDSAQLIGLKPDARHWLDLGSGGGFPGAVIALLMKDRTEGEVDLVESNRKKAAFLTTELSRLAAPARVHPIRIEDAAARIEAPDVVTARALAPLFQLLHLASPWLTQGAVGLFHKGRDYRQEIAIARDAWAFDLIEVESKVDPESRILEISGLRAI